MMRGSVHRLRIAIVHEWLEAYAGSERVLEQLLELYPSADLFSVVDFVPEEQRDFLRGRVPATTFIQRLPGARKRFRSFLPLMPLAIEQLDLSGYDVILSSSHAVAKGVITGPDQVHVSYVHSPMRYAWDLQHQYLREAGLEHGPRSWAARAMLHYLRGWDVRSANGVDCFVANSRYIARRIRKAYRREAEVVHPPVDVEAFSLGRDKEEFYLTASRMVPYKRVDLIAEAFSRTPERRLVVVGEGPEMAKVRAKAGPNVEILGHQPFEVLRDLMQRARAFVFAAEEDFGIVPVEAQACGTPVIAFGRGGVVDSVRGLENSAPTGVLFEAQTAESLLGAVDRFEQERGTFDAESIRSHAQSFSAPSFRERFARIVERAWAERKA